jgi:hypothetical protein
VRNKYNILVGKPEEKRPVEKHRCRSQNNIKMYLREMGFENVDWMCTN